MPASSALDLRRLLPLSRAQAFAVHLTLSLLVFSSLVFAMLLWWFPGELFLLDGGWQGLKLVAMVDLVLGPALTLALYKPGKPKLVLDMSLIAFIQIAALGYGFVTTYQQRTVAIVYAEGLFGTVSAKDAERAAADLRSNDIEPVEIATLVDGSERAGATAPVPLLMTPELEKGAYGKYFAELMNGLPELVQRSDRYVVLGGEATPPASRALTLESLADEPERKAIERALREKSLDIDDVELHRFRTRYAKGIAIWNPATVRIVDYVPTPRRKAAVVTAEAADPGDG